jgi:hypothetical protein
MKSLIAAMGCALLSLVSTTAGAAGYDYGYGESPWGGAYFGASVGELYYREDAIPPLNSTVAMFRFGQQFSPYLAIEGRLGGTVTGSDDQGFRADSDVLYAGYAKGILPFNRWISVYAIGGLGGAQMHRNYPAFNTNDIALSYGGGVEANVGGGASLSAEWAHLTNGENIGYNYNASMLTFGVSWHPWWGF